MTKTITYYGQAIIRKGDKVTLRIGSNMTIDMADVDAAIAFIDDMMLQSVKAHANTAMKVMGVGNDWKVETKRSYFEGDRRKSKTSKGLPTVLYSISIREECYKDMLHFDEMMTYLQGLKHGAETTLALRKEVA